MYCSTIHTWVHSNRRKSTGLHLPGAAEILGDNTMKLSSKVAGSFLIATVAPVSALYAQAQPTASGTQTPQILEEIVVTGTLLRDKDVQSVNPVTIIGEDQIYQSGATSLVDLLQRTTLVQVPV